MDVILVGSRGYGVNSDDDDWNYMVIVPEDQVESLVNKWRSTILGLHIEKVDDLLVPATHRVRGVGILSSSGMDSILIIPRPVNVGSGTFILGNSVLYTLVNLVPENVDVAEVKRRLLYIKEWARVYGFYDDQQYPDGLCYLIFVMNTMAYGYTLEGSMAVISNKSLYYHHILGYSHMRHVSIRSLQRMRKHQRSAGKMITVNNVAPLIIEV